MSVNRINISTMNGGTYRLNGVNRIDGDLLNGIEELGMYDPDEIEMAFAQLGQPIDLTQDQTMNGIFSAIGGAIKGIVGGVKAIVGKIKQNQQNKAIVEQMTGQKQAGFLQLAKGGAQPVPQYAPAQQYAPAPAQFQQQEINTALALKSAEDEEEKKKRNQMLMIGGALVGVYLLTKEK